ncbi:hypothetical protein GCM10010402_66020 [Actinomadura luteofluorescens]|uniref:hypothetical protein n=1 Tax=Actinomadura luteofluorescens TaxID=46163 RepID=UPI0021648423|nr:hypothetical protein [Actinomadura glauciflava]MCR3744224.1 hypothetical protein [Actinomadura glauciflava]
MTNDGPEADMQHPAPNEATVQDIEVEPVDEPDEPEEGDLDPADTYTEGDA